MKCMKYCFPYSWHLHSQLVLSAEAASCCYNTNIHSWPVCWYFGVGRQVSRWQCFQQ